MGRGTTGLRPLAVCISTIAVAIAIPASAAQAATCAPPDHPGGDWPLYGHDHSNTRSQPDERLISPANVARLAPAWSFSTGNPSGMLDGSFYLDINHTPLVAGGCVYFGSAASDRPNVFAVNADTGELVWKTRVRVIEPGGPAIVGSPTVSGERLIVMVDELGDGPTSAPDSGTKGPHVVALDRATGELLWKSDPFVTGDKQYSHATPTVTGGVVVAGFSAREADRRGHGGFALIDEDTGETLKRTFTIPESEWGTLSDPSHAGGGVWTTPAADPATGHVYMGTGNPYSKQVEHEHTNAILKVDVDRSRASFGEIVASYKGTIDQYHELLHAASRPTCRLAPVNPLDESGLVASLSKALGPAAAPLVLAGFITGCLQLDFGFGAAVHLFPGPGGQQLVGGLQKSGVYHVARTSDMRGRWKRALHVPCLLCNAGSPAYDPQRGSVYASLTPAGAIASLGAAGGGLRWYRPTPGTLGYQAPSTANGIVYMVDNLGVLHGLDARNGRTLLLRPTLLDGPGLQAVGAVSSSGIAIARNTVYVPAGNTVVAYRLPSR